MKRSFPKHDVRTKLQTRFLDWRLSRFGKPPFMNMYVYRNIYRLYMYIYITLLFFQNTIYVYCMCLLKHVMRI